MASAQTPTYRIRTRTVAETQAEQRNLLSQWCRLDWEGSRLSAAGWKKFEPVTSLRTEPDFNSIYVISRYDIPTGDRISMESSVTYNVIGRYELGVGFTPESGTRVVNFRFSDKEGELQIVDIDPPQPNVSKPFFVNWLKSQLATAKTPADKVPLQTALDKLVPPPPKPKAEEGSSSSKQTK